MNTKDLVLARMQDDLQSKAVDLTAVKRFLRDNIWDKESNSWICIPIQTLDTPRGSRQFLRFKFEELITMRAMEEIARIKLSKENKDGN